MSGSSRREFCRGLWGLACLGLGACKIEPILDIRDEQDELPLMFPELPPQIPDQLEDAETTLRALTEQLLDRELPLLRAGSLRERPSESEAAVKHFVELMRDLGLGPAGERGGWLQPVMLDIVEATGARPWVALRPQTDAPSAPPSEPDAGGEADAAAPAKRAAPANPAAPPDSPDQPDSPDSPAQPAGQDPAAQPPSPAQPDAPAPAPSRALELTALGAFRQRGDAKPYAGLLFGPVYDPQSPLPAEQLAGHVVVVRAPKDLDLASADAPARVDLLMSVVRDAGALGCLMLTRDDGEQIQRFATSWQRQVRRAGGMEQPMLIEGLLAAAARKPIEAALADKKDAWVLDVDLAMRSYLVKSNNVLGRVTGRDRPDEAVVLTCNWDTPDPRLAELHTQRLLATLGAFFQLAEWSRRSAPPAYSLVLLLTVDAGLAAGQSVHAAWSASSGVQTTALLALDRPSMAPAPAVLLTGHYDARVVELARRVVAADGHELVLDEQLSMASLVPYLRYPGLVMTIGAPIPEGVEGVELEAERDETDDEGADAEPDAAPPPDPRAGLHADIRLLRNLVLALAARGR